MESADSLAVSVAVVVVVVVVLTKGVSSVGDGALMVGVVVPGVVTVLGVCVSFTGSVSQFELVFWKDERRGVCSAVLSCFSRKCRLMVLWCVFSLSLANHYETILGGRLCFGSVVRYCKARAHEHRSLFLGYMSA